MPAQHEGTLTFEIKDELRHPFYWWPRTLLSYPVRFDDSDVKLDELTLTKLESDEVTEYQLSNAIIEKDRLISATLNFFSDLPSGQSRRFGLAAVPQGSESKISAPVHRVTEYLENDAVVLDSGSIKVRIPLTHQDDRKIPGPVLQMNRGSGWVGDSAVISPNVKIASFNSEKTHSGPLFTTYSVTYRFENGGEYKADVTCTAGMDFIRISEEMKGLSKDDGIHVRTDWTGFSPTHRQTSHHPFGNVYKTGEYAGEKMNEPVFHTQHGLLNARHPDGELPFRLGLYEPWNQYAIVSHACFWNSETFDTLGIFIDRAARWQDHEYAVWFSSDTLQVRYYDNDGEFYWKWPLSSGTRSTALAFYDHRKDIETMEELEERYAKAERGEGGDGFRYETHLPLTNYTYFLKSRYGALDLNIVKDWILAYPDDRKRPTAVFEDGECADPSDLERKVVCSPLVCNLPNHGIGATDSRIVYRFFVDGYNRLYPKMSDGQRRRLTSVYLFLAYYHAGEDFMPMMNMLGGHPNFLSDVKSVPAYMAFLFPEHPKAVEWSEQFEKTLELNTRYHTRPAVKSWEARGGRWTENLGTYVWAFAWPSLFASVLLREHTDGKNRFAMDKIAEIGNWLVQSLSSPIGAEDYSYYLKPELTWNGGKLHPHYWGLVKPADGPRRVHVPQGAHAARRKPSRILWLMAKQLMRYDPIAAEHMLWAAKPDDDDFEPLRDENAWDILFDKSDGNRGTNPHLRSAKFTGYGFILRSATETDDEVFVNLQQIDSGPNYRWGVAGEGGSGALYYYAGGKAYSHNGKEDSGDRYAHDTDFGCTFGVWKHGAFRTIGRNVLLRPLYHLGTAQHAEIVPRTKTSPYSWPEYQGRSVMLVGNDYIVVYDSVYSKSIVHRFSWFVHLGDEFPHIHFIKGGGQKTEIVTAETKGVWHDGTGDCMTLITHKPEVSAEKTAFGCIARTNGSTDYIFKNGEEISYSDDDVQFIGSAGVIRKRGSVVEMSLFNGSLVRAGGVSVEIADPETGIGVAFDKEDDLAGVYFTRKEVSVTLTLTEEFREGMQFYVDGKAIEAERSGRRLTVTLPPGEHEWQMTAMGPTPIAPVILRTENRSEAADVFFVPVPAANDYRLEISEDGGESWAKAGETTDGKFAITGIANGKKIHARVVAYNETRESKPSNEYPIYVTGNAPLPPDGLKAAIRGSTTELSWGEILGVHEYRLYRRAKGEERFNLIYRGSHRFFLDAERSDALFEYVVSAMNGNGESFKSNAIHADSSSWLHFEPKPGETFRRRFTDAYDGKPYSVFEFGIKPFTDSGFETWKSDVGNIPSLDDNEDDALKYPE